MAGIQASCRVQYLSSIPIPAPNRKITLHAVAARESTTDKVPVFCKYKDKPSWCSTRRRAYFKAEVKCGVAFHGEEENGGTDCPNLAAPILRSQKGLQVGDRDEEGELSKRQRRGTTGGGKR